jgi:uncharacterized protein
MGGYFDAPPPQPGVGAEAGQGYGPRGPSDDHLWALLSYLLTFVAGLLAPLIVFVVKMNESRYVRYHAAQSLNMSITALIYAFAAFFVGLIGAIATKGWGLVLIVPLFIAYMVVHLVYLILAAIAANRGEYYRVPTIISLPMVH